MGMQKSGAGWEVGVIELVGGSVSRDNDGKRGEGHI